MDKNRERNTIATMAAILLPHDCLPILSWRGPHEGRLVCILRRIGPRSDETKIKKMAVRVGFEPTEPVKVQRFSRPPDSTTLAPHRAGCFS